jgi:Predicted membrane protein
MATSPTFHPGSLQAPSAARQQRSLLRRLMGKVGDFLIEYWAHILTIALGLLVLAAIAVPFLSYLGLDVIAKPLFFTLHLVCAQIPSHSFYIYGHQLGLCARNLSIYTSMFIGCLVFVLSKKRLPGIPWYVWILMLLPMAWDGLTQMFGLRESDWILRVVTGTLFGIGNIWFALPLMQKSLLETETPPTPSSHLDYQQRYAARQQQVPTTPAPTSPSTQAGHNAL